MDGGTIAFEEADISHVRGTIFMASSTAGVSRSAVQFFIMQENSISLDGRYGVFGHVVEGMEIVDKITDVSLGPNRDKPEKQSVPLTRSMIIYATEVAN